MWSRNHACSELREPTLGRVIPFTKLLKVRTREETPLFSYFFCRLIIKQIHMCCDFLKIFSCFCVNKFYDVIRSRIFFNLSKKNVCFEFLKKYKKELIKNIPCWKWPKKKEKFLRKMLVWIKDDRDSMTRWENLQKRH